MISHSEEETKFERAQENIRNTEKELIAEGENYLMKIFIICAVLIMLSGLRIEGGEMGRTCSKHYGVSIAYTFSIGKFRDRTPLWRHRIKWRENTIKASLSV